jgi:hypothetical protein
MTNSVLKRMASEVTKPYPVVSPGSRRFATRCRVAIERCIALRTGSGVLFADADTKRRKS